MDALTDVIIKDHCILGDLIYINHNHTCSLYSCTINDMALSVFKLIAKIILVLPHQDLKTLEQLGNQLKKVRFDHFAEVRKCYIDKIDISGQKQDIICLVFILPLFSEYKMLSQISLSRCFAKYVLAQLVDTLLFLKQKGIIHRNFNSHNICVDDKCWVYVLDFDLSETMIHSKLLDSVYHRVEPLTMAPQIITMNTCSYKSDWWSVGKLMSKYSLEEVNQMMVEDPSKRRLPSIRYDSKEIQAIQELWKLKNRIDQGLLEIYRSPQKCILLQQIDLSEVKQLRLIQNDLNSLEFLGQCNLTQLQTFQASRGQIKTVKLVATWFRNIKSINLNDNRIDSLGWLQKLHFQKLQNLSLRSNLIANVEVLGRIQLESLKQLVLAHNRITKFPHLKCPELQTVQLNNNSIGEVSWITSIKSIKVLKLQYNMIGDVQALEKTDSQHIIHLDLCSNKLINFPFRHCLTEIKQLSLQSNQIVSCNFVMRSRFGNLNSLNLKGNKILAKSRLQRPIVYTN